jgi:hypothetical protein
MLQIPDAYHAHTRLLSRRCACKHTQETPFSGKNQMEKRNVVESGNLLLIFLFWARPCPRWLLVQTHVSARPKEDSIHVLLPLMAVYEGFITAIDWGRQHGLKPVIRGKRLYRERRVQWLKRQWVRRQKKRGLRYSCMEEEVLSYSN